MKYLKSILFISFINIVSILVFATTVLAVPSDVTGLKANPSNTSVDLTWTAATSSTSTVIRYRTDTYPSSHSDGILAFSGGGRETIVQGLTAGQTYYFAAWGYDGANYSVNADNCVVTTLFVALPNGAIPTAPAGSQIPIPTLPASANQTPSIGSFNLEPFTGIINYFVTAPGGLGMPVENAWETLAIGIIVTGGIGTYIKMRNFFIAYFIVLFLTILFVALHLTQGLLVGVEIVVGLGVWALERFFQ